MIRRNERELKCRDGQTTALRYIYARVSVADRQSSALTSIDAQVDACRAYIKSLLDLGWAMVEPAYTGWRQLGCPAH